MPLNPGDIILVKIDIPEGAVNRYSGEDGSAETVVCALRGENGRLLYAGQPRNYSWKFIAGTGRLEHWNGITNSRERFVHRGRRGTLRSHVSYWIGLALENASASLSVGLPTPPVDVEVSESFEDDEEWDMPNEFEDDPLDALDDINIGF